MFAAALAISTFISDLKSAVYLSISWIVLPGADSNTINARCNSRQTPGIPVLYWRF